MKSIRNHRGLTLLELVVVMVILIALAGLLVPLLPQMLGKAHSATHSTNIGELNKVWEMYHVTNRGYPTDLDSLVVDGGTTVYSKLPQPTTSPYSATTVSDLATAIGTATSATVSAADVMERLSEAGITSVLAMNASATSATFDPYVYATGSTTPTVTSIASTTPLCQINATEVNTKLNGNASGVYVVFGVGGRCSAVGRGGMTSAPVHFSDESGENANPANQYHRYGVVFNVAVDPAEFVGAVAFHEDGISGAAEGIAEYYSGH